MKKSFFLLVIAMMLVLAACGGPTKEGNCAEQAVKKPGKSEVNLYTTPDFEESTNDCYFCHV